MINSLPPRFGILNTGFGRSGNSGAATTTSAGTKRQYADYYGDRQSRYFYRGLWRQGVCLDDALLIAAEVDALSDPDLL
jgi:hypothetical protein